MPVAQALLGASRAVFTEPAGGRRQAATRYFVTAYLHGIQPIARLKGRLSHGLTPWRRRGDRNGTHACVPRHIEIWSERWRSREDWLAAFEHDLRASQAVVRNGGDYDSWDLDVRGGSLGGVRIRSLVEEHGQGKQMLRLVMRPRVTSYVVAPTALALLASLAATDGAFAAAAIVAATAIVGGWLTIRDITHAAALARATFERPRHVGEAQA
jgi:O-antigen biosynthesis protein